MSDLAQRIRAAREKLGASIEEAERATKIRRRYIEAIEAGDYARLPDGPPSRGFIKNYARYLGLDPDQSLNDFEAEVGVPITQVNEVIPPPPTRQQATSRYTQLVKLPQVRWKGELPPDEQTELDMMADDSSPRNGNGSGNVPETNALGRLVFRRSEPPTVPNSFSLREPKVTNVSDVRPFQMRSSFSLRIPRNGLGDVVGEPTRVGSISSYYPGRFRNILMLAMAAGGFLVVIALVGLVILPALSGAGGRAAAPEATQVIKVSIFASDQPSTTLELVGGELVDSAAVTDTAAIAPATTPGVEATVEAIAAPTSAPIPAPTVQPLPGGGVELVLDARERAWVRIQLDGNTVYEGIPAIGPTNTWRGQNTVGIETGNAGAFEVIINGARLGPAGARNTTLRVTWDATGKVLGN